MMQPSMTKTKFWLLLAIAFAAQVASLALLGIGLLLDSPSSRRAALAVVLLGVGLFIFAVTTLLAPPEVQPRHSLFRVNAPPRSAAALAILAMRTLLAWFAAVGLALIAMGLATLLRGG